MFRRHGASTADGSSRASGPSEAEGDPVSAPHENNDENAQALLWEAERLLRMNETYADDMSDLADRIAVYLNPLTPERGLGLVAKYFGWEK